MSEVLKKCELYKDPEPDCNIMLKNHENFNAFAGNVKENNI